MHQKLEFDENIEDEASTKKRGKRAKGLEKQAKLHNLLAPELRKTLQVATQLSVQYWRWIRSELRYPVPWQAALNSLREVYARF